MVRAPERSRAAVLEALRSGCFYASSGPEIRDVRVDADGVECAARPRAPSRCARGWDGCRVNAGPLEMNWRGA